MGKTKIDRVRKMKDIAIYGAGGFGREVACMLRRINAQAPNSTIWNMVGFFDDGKPVGYETEYGTVLGGLDALNAVSKPLCVAVAIGSPKVVEKVVGSISNPLVEFPNIFSPDTEFSDKENIRFGHGNIVCLRCSFSCNVSIGDFNVFNGLVTVGHDAIIGNFNSFMPSVRVSGEVNIGNCNFFGVSSVILQKVHIGFDTVIGANSTVIRKTKNGNTYMGNPAQIVKY